MWDCVLFSLPKYLRSKQAVYCCLFYYVSLFCLNTHRVMIYRKLYLWLEKFPHTRRHWKWLLVYPNLSVPLVHVPDTFPFFAGVSACGEGISQARMPHFQVVTGGGGGAVLVKKHLAVQSEVFLSKQLDCKEPAIP